MSDRGLLPFQDKSNLCTLDPSRDIFLNAHVARLAGSFSASRAAVMHGKSGMTQVRDTLV